MATDSSKNNVPVAIVTGSGRGIGRAVALRLAADGYRVVVNYAQSAAAAEGVVSDIEQGGGEAVAIQADIRIVGDIERLFEPSSTPSSNSTSRAPSSPAGRQAEP
jgi:3-oxoacyl-[acyl-carrier protein] reductase